MISCREFADFIRGYLDGELSLPEGIAFRAHLALCSACRAYLKTYEETVRLGKKAFDENGEQIPPEVPEDLVKAVMDARKKLWP